MTLQDILLTNLYQMWANYATKSCEILKFLWNSIKIIKMSKYVPKNIPRWWKIDPKIYQDGEKVDPKIYLVGEKSYPNRSYISTYSEYGRPPPPQGYRLLVYYSSWVIRLNGHMQLIKTLCNLFTLNLIPHVKASKKCRIISIIILHLL